MNGIQGLMGNQGQMPGQAPQQPMPGMMPQQSAPTPGAMVSQLSAMPFEQLAQFYSNPRPQSPPLWAVISAIAEKQKQAKAMQMAQGQQVMAQNQQMQAQPPVAAEVVMSAEQTPGMEEQDTVMAALGGMMHSYAGGGAVAFGRGGNVQHFRNGADEEGVQSSPAGRWFSGLMGTVKEAFTGDPEAEQLRQQIRNQFAFASAPAGVFKQQTDEERQRAKEIMRLLPTLSKEQMKNILGQAQRTGPFEAFQETGPGEFGTSSAQPATEQFQIPPTAAFAGPRTERTRVTGGPQRQATGATITKPQEPAKSGLPSLMGPQIDPSLLMAREGQQNIARALELSAKQTPEEIAAQAGIDKLLSASASSLEEERKRREALAQQRMQEAQARFERPGYMDMAGIGRLLGGMKGAKTFYQGAVGAGEAAGKYQEDKEAALRAAQERFDLSGKEMFDLRRLQSQVEMDQAKLVEARASGNAQRSVQAALKLGESQQNLAKFESDVADKAAGRRLQEEGIKVQREQIASSERIAELNRQAQAALRNLPGPEQQMIENAIKSLMASNPGMAYHEAYDKVRGAGKGLEEKAEFANLRQQATMLQNELKEALSMDPLGKSPRVAQLRTKLDSIYQQLGGGTAGGGASNDPLGIRK